MAGPGHRGDSVKKLAVLAALMAEQADALRADLQQHYGVDIDHAMEGGHTAEHVAALAVQLPSDARIRVAYDKDAMWTLEHVLLASLLNNLRGLIWMLGDKRKRGPEPQPVGPSWMTKGKMRTLESRVLTIDKLMEELSKPRRR